MTKETPDVEIIQGAEHTRSTETVINEKGRTLSEYKTNSNGANDQEFPSEVDVGSEGHERDPVEQNSQTREPSNIGVVLGSDGGDHDDPISKSNGIVADKHDAEASFQTKSGLAKVIMDFVEIEIPFQDATVRRADEVLPDELIFHHFNKCGSDFDASRHNETSNPEENQDTCTATILVNGYKYKTDFDENTVRDLDNVLESSKSKSGDELVIGVCMQRGGHCRVYEFAISKRKLKQIRNAMRTNLRRYSTNLVERLHENALWSSKTGFFERSVTQEKEVGWKPRFPSQIVRNTKSIEEALEYQAALDWACGFLYVKKLVDEGHAEVYDEERWHEVSYLGARLEEMIEQQHPDFPRALYSTG
jgi:hypothetical protein